MVLSADDWRSPRYKPKNTIHPDVWVEFMRAAFIIRENQRQRIRNKLDKNPNKYRELEIYDVFDWMRQELHGELPYTKKRVEALDEQIEREFAREAATNGY
jgi:hypothetical protein